VAVVCIKGENKDCREESIQLDDQNCRVTSTTTHRPKQLVVPTYAVSLTACC
jgi:hypothetical protein